MSFLIDLKHRRLNRDNVMEKLREEHWWRHSPPEGLEFREEPKNKGDAYTLAVVDKSKEGVRWKRYRELSAFNYELARRAESFGDPSKVINPELKLGKQRKEFERRLRNAFVAHWVPFTRLDADMLSLISDYPEIPFVAFWKEGEKIQRSRGDRWSKKMRGSWNLAIPDKKLAKEFLEWIREERKKMGIPAPSNIIKAPERRGPKPPWRAGREFTRDGQLFWVPKSEQRRSPSWRKIELLDIDKYAENPLLSNAESSILSRAKREAECGFRDLASRFVNNIGTQILENL